VPKQVAMRRFGSFPKISTPVENTVENMVLSGSRGAESQFLQVFVEAKVRGWPVSGPILVIERRFPHRTGVSQRRKYYLRGLFE
jgi:hypothetical protein